MDLAFNFGPRTPRPWRPGPPVTAEHDLMPRAEVAAEYARSVANVVRWTVDWPGLWFVRIGPGEWVLSAGCGILVHQVRPDMAAMAARTLAEINRPRPATPPAAPRPRPPWAIQCPTCYALPGVTCGGTGSNGHRVEFEWCPQRIADAAALPMRVGSCRVTPAVVKMRHGREQGLW